MPSVSVNSILSVRNAAFHTKFKKPMMSYELGEIIPNRCEQDSFEVTAQTAHACPAAAILPSCCRSVVAVNVDVVS